MAKSARQLIIAELQRMEEDCIHSGKSHFNASSRWARWNYCLGIPAILLSTAAGAAFFQDYPLTAGVMSLCAALLTSLMTFLKPGEKSSSHKTSGDQYLTLRNEARVLREIDLPTLLDEPARAALKALTNRRDELNIASEQFSNGDRLKARRGIEDGEAVHVVDRETKR